MNDDIAHAKHALRRTLLDARAAMPADERAHASARIAAIVLAMPRLAHPLVVMTYESRPDEAATAPLITALLARGCRVIVPASKGRSASPEEFHEIHDDGTRDRHTAAIIPSVELFLLPGVGFDAQGTRLGFGAGFFDTVLAEANDSSDIVGLAFHRQIVATPLPRAAHDVAMHAVVTERNIIGPQRERFVPHSA